MGNATSITRRICRGDQLVMVNVTARPARMRKLARRRTQTALLRRNCTPHPRQVAIVLGLAERKNSGKDIRRLPQFGQLYAFIAVPSSVSLIIGVKRSDSVMSRTVGCDSFKLGQAWTEGRLVRGRLGSELRCF
jgi:hypothetical protein